VTRPRRLRHYAKLPERAERESSCEQAIVCVHTFPSLGAGVVKRSGSLRWLAAGTIMRLPKVGPQQMTWDAGNAADGRNPLSGYLSPLRDSTPLDPEFPSDQGPETTAGGGAQQVHSGEDSGHPTTLSDPKRLGKPSMCGNAQYLCRETKLALWHTKGMTIGERIAAARTNAGLSQQDVARALGEARLISGKAARPSPRSRGGHSSPSCWICG
jgi:hypothetical protein